MLHETSGSRKNGEEGRMRMGTNCRDELAVETFYKIGMLLTCVWALALYFPVQVEVAIFNVVLYDAGLRRFSRLILLIFR